MACGTGRPRRRFEPNPKSPKPHHPTSHKPNVPHTSFAIIQFWAVIISIAAWNLVVGIHLALNLDQSLPPCFIQSARFLLTLSALLFIQRLRMPKKCRCAWGVPLPYAYNSGLDVPHTFRHKNTKRTRKMYIDYSVFFLNAQPLPVPTKLVDTCPPKYIHCKTCRV